MVSPQCFPKVHGAQIESWEQDGKARIELKKDRGFTQTLKEDAGGSMWLNLKFQLHSNRCNTLDRITQKKMSFLFKVLYICHYFAPTHKPPEDPGENWNLLGMVSTDRGISENWPVVFWELLNLGILDKMLSITMVLIVRAIATGYIVPLIYAKRRVISPYFFSRVGNSK